MAKRARIIVVGCSLFGCAVAQALSAAGHDVIVVDMQEDALDGLGPDFDGETLTGDGKSALVMEECGVRRATHLVAATGDDASNLLIAELASEIFGVSHVLPLVDDDALADILDDMGIAPIFAAEVYGIPMPLDRQLTVILLAVLASIGSMGVPGAALIMITMVFTQVGIPLEAIALVAGVDRIMDMARTTINVLGDATGALFVSKLESDFDPERGERLAAAE